MLESTCGICEAELPAGLHLCHDDTTRLEELLDNVPHVWAELMVTIERRDAGADALGTSGPTGSAAPLNLDALDSGQTLQIILTGWASQLSGLHPTRNHDGLLHIRTAAWLRQNINQVRRHDWAADLLSELAESLTECQRATDRAADKISLGACRGQGITGGLCPDMLTAISGAHTARCRTCGTIWNVKERQAWMISEAWHITAPLPQIIRALRTLKVYIKPKDAENWVARGKLIACIDEAGQKTYQLRQAHQVHLRMKAKREATEARKQLRATLEEKTIAA